MYKPLAEMWSKFWKKKGSMEDYEKNSKKAREEWLSGGDRFSERYKATQIKFKPNVIIMDDIEDCRNDVLGYARQLNEGWDNNSKITTTFSMKNGNLSFDELADKGDAAQMVELDRQATEAVEWLREIVGVDPPVRAQG